MATRDYIGEARAIWLRNIRDNKTAQKCYKDCLSRFNVFHVLNNMMYMQAVNAIDKLEEDGLLRQKIKQEWNKCEKVWNKYQHVMRTHLENGAWYLLQDYCAVAYNMLEKDLYMLELCCANFLLKKNYLDNHSVIAKLSVSINIANIIKSMKKRFFQTYRELCSLDFTNEFRYADMTDFHTGIVRIAEVISKKYGKIDYSEDVNCQNAAFAIANKISAPNFLDDAAYTALSYSKDYKQEFNEVKKLREEKNGRH